MQKYSEIVATTKADGTVEVLPGATVTVYLTGTTTLASLYSDNGITAKANPFQSAALTGRIEFYAADGRYDIKIDKAGYTTVTVADILIEDPEDIGILEDVTLVDATISTSTVTNSTLSQCILVNTEIQDVDSLQLTNTPPAVLQPRMLSWNNDEGTADLSLLDGTVLQMGQELHYRARNNTASTIADGAVVWATGTSGATGRINIGLAVADGSQPGKTVMGLMTHATAAGSDGYVTNFGKVRGINTTGSAVGETWLNGDILYLHPTIPGALTKVKPAVNGNIVVTVAIVIYAGNNGTLFVRPTADSQEADEIRYTPAGTGAVATTVQSKLRESVSVLDKGADPTGVADSTAAFVAAATHNGKVYAPAGTYSIDTVTAASLHIVGDGIGKTTIRLRSTTTATVLNVDTLRLEDLTLSDNGRPSLDHSTGGAYLCDCVDVFDARRIEFLTDRSVLLQSAVAASSYTNVEDCTLARVTVALANEYEDSNIFTILESRRVNFVNLRTSGDLVGRSIINATRIQTAVGANNPVIANVERCSFALFRHNGLNVDAEVKVIFLQGYLARVVQNQFVDCFGRHIDLLSNYDAGSANATIYKSLVENNKVDFTTANAAIAGSAFNEPGSIYCRYADVIVSGNHQNFTNLTLSSNVYAAISVRHGYKSAIVFGNTVIGPKAYAINADISDAIDTDKCNVSIRDNIIQNATNGSRKPIAVLNNAATKTFDTVVIEGNSIEYSDASSAIQINTSPARASSFSVDSLTVSGNWNKTFNTYDVVDFQTFPEYMFAPNTDVTVSVNPAGTNAAGVITSLSDAVSMLGRYRCNNLTIQLSSAVTTTQTVTGPTGITIRPRKTTINGNNGLSGRIRFYTAGTQQQNVSCGLSGNELEFSGCIFNSDSGTSTTSLVALTGWGHCQLTNCDAQYGEYFVDSMGPDFSIKGGTINDINLGNSGNRAIVQTQGNRQVKCTIEDATGVNNTRLYNFLVPTFFAYENISVGVTTGNKTYTLVP